jgi:hypothetical protein
MDLKREAAKRMGSRIEQFEQFRNDAGYVQALIPTSA